MRRRKFRRNWAIFVINSPMNFNTHRMPFLALAALSLLMPAEIRARAAQPAPPEAQTFFREQVYPILRANCIKCHGGEKTKGGLEMTSRVALLKGGETGAAIDASAPEKSLLLEMISYKDKDHEMPPAGKRPPEEIAIIEKWVAMGVPYDPALETAGAKKHSPHPTEKTSTAPQSWWAYQPVKKVAPPVVKNAAWSANPVDAFLASRLESADLRPNAPATKEQLIRRAYYNLIGLPPAPAEVEKFVADQSPDAWQRLIEELLAVPR